MTLLLMLHRNKENEPSSLNGNAPPRRARRSNTANPYEKRIPFSQVPVPVPASHASESTRSSTRALASIEAEPSPIIRGILQKTGCSSRQELMAKRAAEEAQQANTNMSSTGTNGAKKATKTATNVSTKSSSNTATNGSKIIATNACKSSTNRAKAKSTNGSKSMNPKKKSKGMYYG